MVKLYQYGKTIGLLITLIANYSGIDICYRLFNTRIVVEKGHNLPIEIQHTPL